MTQRASALLCLLMAAMTLGSSAKAGVWGSDPVLGFTGDYATNPLLNDGPTSAQTHGAVLLDAPTAYTADAFKLSVLPSFRVGDSQGYSSLTSDYQRVNAQAEFDTPLNTIMTTAGVSRDSTLSQTYLTNGSTGVRRDSATGDFNWDRKFTETVDLDTDFSATRARYDQPPGQNTLVNYKYVSLSPTLTWASSERNQFTISATAGRYNTLDGSNESRNANLQLGFTRKLSEVWTLTASGGYSRALNRIETEELVPVFTPIGIFYEIVPVIVSSSQNGSVYAVNLSHQGQQLLLTASASRRLAASGLALLSTQDNYELNGKYMLSDRWSVTGDLHHAIYKNPQTNGTTSNIDVGYYTLSANWQWTEQWVVALSVSHVAEKVQLPTYSAASNEVTITLSRHFNHIELR